LDIDSIIRQAHDEGEYNNAFVNFLKKQADTAQQELSDSKKDKKTTRKPKYLQQLDDEVVLDVEYQEEESEEFLY
jgi:hypothetical protein